MKVIQNSTLTFLNRLKKNNNREWFSIHKIDYESARSNVAALAQEVLDMMRVHDDLDTLSGKKALYRIYRDVRFSKDKSPYKNHFAAYFRRSSMKLRGGYYFSITPEGATAAGGFWGPNKEDLKLIRDQIAMDDSPLRKVLQSRRFKEFFGELEGEQLKTAPKGWDKEHESIDLLRYKQFLLTKHFSKEETLNPEFAHQLHKTFKAMRPFLDVMSMYLSTDLNGEELY